LKLKSQDNLILVKWF